MVPQPWLDLLVVIFGYLCGALPMGVIVARVSGARDPRTVGSGRTGGTNALRAMGARRAVLVAALDVAKGFVAVALATAVGASTLAVALTGAAAVLGAWASVFLRFHGGRGVATAIGATLFIQPLAMLLAAPFFFGTIWLTRYVSLGSLLGTAAGALAIVLRPDRLEPASRLPVRRAGRRHRVDRPSRQHRPPAARRGAPLRPLRALAARAEGTPEDDDRHHDEADDDQRREPTASSSSGTRPVSQANISTPATTTAAAMTTSRSRIVRGDSLTRSRPGWECQSAPPARVPPARGRAPSAGPAWGGGR